MCGTLEGMSRLPATEMVRSLSLVCQGDSARKPRPCLAGSTRHPIWCEANGGRAAPMSRQQVGHLALLEGATMGRCSLQLQTLLRAWEARTMVIACSGEMFRAVAGRMKRAEAICRWTHLDSLWGRGPASSATAVCESGAGHNRARRRCVGSSSLLLAPFASSITMGSCATGDCLERFSAMFASHRITAWTIGCAANEGVAC